MLNFNGEEEEEHKGPVVGFNKGSERLVARQPGTDLSRLKMPGSSKISKDLDKKAY